HAVIAQRLWALAVRDQLREPLDDRRLADARLTDEHRVVLLATREHFHHALDFLRASNRRIQLRSEERRVGKSVPCCVDLGGRRIIKKKKKNKKRRKRAVQCVEKIIRKKI